MLNNHHIPVLLNEVKQYLITENPLFVEGQDVESFTFFDGTLGGGGYTKMMLELDPRINIIATDLDNLAIQNFWDFTSMDKEKYDSKITFIQASFLDAIQSLPDKSLDGVVLDLGFSTNQMEIGSRGFAYLAKDQEEPFDLRFDETSGTPAYEIIKSLQSSKELGNIIFNYSGETLARKIAENLYNDIRQTPAKSVVTVAQALVAIRKGIPKQFLHKEYGILSRIWQALRIWINNELSILEQFLPMALKKLKSGGRLVVVDFHSLEDKIVTKWMRNMAEPISVNKFGEKTFLTKLKTRRGVEPTPEEVTTNPRSRSGTLRCLEKV